VKEACLAERIPLWRTLREDDVTALVTPALDYVGGLRVSGVDPRYWTEAQRAQLGEGLRDFLGGLEEEANLLFLLHTTCDVEADIARHEAAAAADASAVGRAYVQAKAAWLRAQPLRRSTLHCFFCRDGGNGPLDRGVLGAPLLFKNAERLSTEVHSKRLAALRALRDRLQARLAALGLQSEELLPEDVRALHWTLLNPGRPGVAPPDVELVDNLWGPELVRAEGRHLVEYTEAEALCLESPEEERDHFRQGRVLRRVLTLKVLPESRTRHFEALPFQGLVHPRTGAPLPYWLCVCVHVKPQGRATFALNQRHKLVAALRGLVHQVSGEDARRDVADAHTQGAIEHLFAELESMSSKLVDLSVTLLLEAESLEELEARTEAAHAAARQAGNSGLLVEDVAQLPAYFACFPGAGRYQLRRKGCTSRNAADFLPVFEPWGGSETADSLFTTPLGTPLRFGLFDSSMGNAFHGLICADTGAGKSLTAGALVADAFLAGKDAILVDNGRSWARLTRVLGGAHLDVTLNTPLCPFLPYRQMLDAGATAGSGVETLDNTLVQEVVGFLQLCVEDREVPSFTIPEQALVGRAVVKTYEALREMPEARPLMGDFQAQLETCAADTDLHPEDRALAGRLVRRLELFCTGTYGRFLNAPSDFSTEARLVTFEMGAIGKDALLKRIAFAAVMGAITARAASRRSKTVVAIDEAHDYLGDSPAADAFLGKAYAKMRKFDVAMWAISQKFEDFQRSAAAATIIGNSFLKLFLWHSSGWEVVQDALGWPDRMLQAFRGLERVPFRFTDFLLLYGQHVATVRHAVSPLTYWLLTTHGDDVRLLERAGAANPGLDEFALLQAVAARYPPGGTAPMHARS
jgi:hypothetical protein